MSATILPEASCGPKAARASPTTSNDADADVFLMKPAGVITETELAVPASSRPNDPHPENS